LGKYVLQEEKEEVRLMAAVKVYTSPGCVWCAKVKEYLDKKKVAYEEVNVAVDRESAMDMVRRTKQRGVPVVDVDGEFISGFDQDALDYHFGT
jgi:glutaredoxin 3